MTKQNEMPEYVWLDDDSACICRKKLTGDTRYALCPKGSFVVSRAQLDKIAGLQHCLWEKYQGNSGKYYPNNTEAFSGCLEQAINEILKIGESDE